MLELAKVKITFAVALTTITGYLLAGGAFDSGLILPTIGIFLLACGSSALNHYQERDKDALMERTRNRPLPSGRAMPGFALFYAGLLAVAGSVALWLGPGLPAMQLGLLALIWYNGIYTPLKRRTAFAVIPGSVIGAIPPLVGWVSGGGSLLDPRAMILAFFFFIWQVPHFWLLMLKYGREYESAGLPSLTASYKEGQVRRMTFVWTLATAISALMLPFFGITVHLATSIGIALSAVWLVSAFSPLLRPVNGRFRPRPYFMKINYFVLAILVLLSVDALV